MLPHPGFETKRTGIPASILEGSLLKAIYWLLPLESPSNTHLLEPEPDSKQNTPLLSRTHQRRFLPKVYNGWISASGEYSNMCIISLSLSSQFLILSTDYRQLLPFFSLPVDLTSGHHFMIYKIFPQLLTHCRSG